MEVIKDKMSIDEITKRKLNIRSLREILEDKTEPPEPVIGNGILLEKTLCLLTGEPKVGKSLLVYNLAISLSRGKGNNFFSINKKYKAMILSAEGGYYPNRDRAKKMMNGLITDKENLFICFDSRIKLDMENDLDELKSVLKEFKPDVLIIDPFVRFHCKNENMANEMAEVMGTLRQLIEDYNLSIILVHHSGKGQSNDSRGSSVIQSEYDSCIIMKEWSDGIKCSFDMRHVETPADKHIKLNGETLWFELEVPEQNIVKSLLIEYGEMDKSTLTKLMEKNEVCTRGNAYKLVDKAEEQKLISIGDGGLYFAI